MKLFFSTLLAFVLGAGSLYVAFFEPLQWYNRWIVGGASGMLLGLVLAIACAWRKGLI